MEVQVGVGPACQQELGKLGKQIRTCGLLSQSVECNEARSLSGQMLPGSLHDRCNPVITLFTSTVSAYTLRARSTRGFGRPSDAFLSRQDELLVSFALRLKATAFRV